MNRLQKSLGKPRYVCWINPKFSARHNVFKLQPARRAEAAIEPSLHEPKGRQVVHPSDSQLIHTLHPELQIVEETRGHEILTSTSHRASSGLIALKGIFPLR